VTRRDPRRKYGWAHRQLRKALLERWASSRCVRCGELFTSPVGLDLDHRDDGDKHPSRYLGLAHASCNRSAGAQRGNAMRGPQSPEPETRTQW